MRYNWCFLLVEIYHLLIISILFLSIQREFSYFGHILFSPKRAIGQNDHRNSDKHHICLAVTVTSDLSRFVHNTHTTLDHNTHNTAEKSIKPFHHRLSSRNNEDNSSKMQVHVFKLKINSLCFGCFSGVPDFVDKLHVAAKALHGKPVIHSAPSQTQQGPYNPVSGQYV